MEDHRRKLSKRELEVLTLLSKGKSNREIAVALDISRKTVEEHLTTIYSKIGAKSRTEAIIGALKNLGVSLIEKL